jgi:ABC-2 type transport system permease protein
VSAYVALFSARVRMLLQYRAAALAGVGTQLVFGLIRIMILQAFYLNATGVQPMSGAEVVDYIWLSQATLTLLPIWIDGEIRGMVRSGTVVYELTRPVDLYAFWYARALASRLAPVMLRAAPLLLLAALIFDLRPPASVEAGVACLVALLGALLLSGAISTLTNITVLWTIAGEGTAQLLSVMIVVLSGMVVPLALFPDWLQPFLMWQPFAGLMDLPLRIYSGNLPTDALGGILLRQALWTVALIGFGRWLLGRGTRSLVVQGG